MARDTSLDHGSAGDRPQRPIGPAPMLLLGVAIAVVAFGAGRWTAGSDGAHAAAAGAAGEALPGEVMLVQWGAQDDPRELIPIPGPGQAQGLEEALAECLLMLEQEGLEPGAVPAPGAGEGPGGGPQELIPLQPLRPGPGVPGPLQPPRPRDPPGTLRTESEPAFVLSAAH